MESFPRAKPASYNHLSIPYAPWIRLKFNPVHLSRLSAPRIVSQRYRENAKESRLHTRSELTYGHMTCPSDHEPAKMLVLWGDLNLRRRVIVP